MMNCVKPAVSSLYSERGSNSSHNCQEEAVFMLYMQAIWDWLYDYWDIYPLNKPNTQVMVNAVVKGVPSA